MRFLHTADWHIGKKLHGFDLAEEQRMRLTRSSRSRLSKT